MISSRHLEEYLSGAQRALHKPSWIPFLQREMCTCCFTCDAPGHRHLHWVRCPGCFSSLIWCAVNKSSVLNYGFALRLEEKWIHQRKGRCQPKNRFMYVIPITCLSIDICGNAITIRKNGFEKKEMLVISIFLTLNYIIMICLECFL